MRRVPRARQVVMTAGRPAIDGAGDYGESPQMKNTVITKTVSGMRTIVKRWVVNDFGLPRHFFSIRGQK